MTLFNNLRILTTKISFSLWLWWGGLLWLAFILRLCFCVSLWLWLLFVMWPSSKKWIKAVDDKSDWKNDGRKNSQKVHVGFESVVVPVLKIHQIFVAIYPVCVKRLLLSFQDLRNQTERDVSEVLLTIVNFVVSVVLFQFHIIDHKDAWAVESS